MTITIGWNANQHLFMLQLYVPALNNVHVQSRAPMQVVYFIQLMQKVYPIHIGWDHTMPEDVKAALVKVIQEHITV